MQRLTLRDPKDARFLARIVDRDGFAFVLDYGDASTIADATDRIARGFTLGTGDDERFVPPNTPKFLDDLALHYLHAGLDVALETPPQQVHGRVVADPDATRMRVRAEVAAAKPTPAPNDENTEYVTLESMPLNAAGMTVTAFDAEGVGLDPYTTLDPPDEDDEPTELVPEEMRMRAMDPTRITQRHSTVGQFAAMALEDDD